MKSTRILRQAVTLVYVSLGLAQQNPGFYPKGISGLVTSIVSTHDGLYAVGNFDGGDGIYSPGAVLWDGTRWAPLGGGFSTSGYELQGCLLGGRLAITGSISSVDGKPCHGIAEWDGKSWDCPEISGRLPAATTLWRDSLLVATDSGAFKQAGGGWESYGRKYFRTPVSNRFGAEGGKLWMYGQFEMVGDSSFKNLAVWENGDWKKPFPIHPERVIDLIWFQDALYLIARIASASEDSIGIYRSNATILERLPVQYPHATLDKFVTDGKSLFVLGGHKKWFDPAFEPFVLIGRREGLQLGRLDAGAFSLMKEHVFNGLVTDAEFVQDKLVVAGRFSGIGGVRADNIATWDGTQWSPISTIAEPGPSYAAAAMRSDGKSLIVGGVFLDYAGNGRVGGVAKWDGIHWSGYLQGFTYSASAKYPENFPTPKITAIGVEGSDVYVGGEFDGSESGRVLNVAHWDGVNWKSLGDGYHGGVNDILVDGNEVYVAGPVSTRDSLSDIATMGQGPVSKWNGNSWTDLHLEVFGKVVRLAMFGGELYAAGVFSSQGNNNPGLAVRRNGSWGFIGAKAYEATDMVKVGQELYV